MRPEGYDYDTYSRLAGPLTEPSGASYQVQYTSLLSREPHRIRAVLLMSLAPVLTAALLVYLVRPTHWVEREGGQEWMVGLDITMLIAIGLIELFMVVNVASVAHATLVARDPIPVVPEAGTRVAFLTTYVPGKEPLSMVRATLEGAVGVTHTGPVDVWLLDEGDDEQAKALCAELGGGRRRRPDHRAGVEPAGRPQRGRLVGDPLQQGGVVLAALPLPHLDLLGRRARRVDPEGRGVCRVLGPGTGDGGLVDVGGGRTAHREPEHREHRERADQPGHAAPLREGTSSDDSSAIVNDPSPHRALARRAVVV